MSPNTHFGAPLSAIERTARPSRPSLSSDRDLRLSLSSAFRDEPRPLIHRPHPPMNATTRSSPPPPSNESDNLRRRQRRNGTTTFDNARRQHRPLPRPRQ